MSLDQGLKRQELEALSIAKLEDATLLFENGRWSNAYYLAGYAVELALKACAARQFIAEAIPPKGLVNDLHSHNLPRLISLAGLQRELSHRQDADEDFAINWGLVAEWRPEARYQAYDRSSADYLLHAIKSDAHGVLQWIRTFW